MLSKNFAVDIFFDFILYVFYFLALSSIIFAGYQITIILTAFRN